MKLIWRIFTQSSSLWVSWVKHYLLRYNSFWDVRDDTKGSWIWRKLLKLRNVAYHFLKVDIRDGQSSHFWFDNWTGKGRLIDITWAIGTTYLGVVGHARVSDAGNTVGWRIRGQKSRHFGEIHQSIMALAPPNPESETDIFLWKHGEDNYQATFSASKTWDQLRVKKPKVAWSRVVWFSQGVPRFSFITWLTVKNRLSTGDRMRQWGLVQGCVLCGERDETRDHLFFACPYSYTVWEGLARRLMGRGINPDWHWTINHLQWLREKRMNTILAKMLLQSVIYHLWRERNARRHHQTWTTTDQLRRVIDKAVRNKIVSLQYKFDHKSGGLLQRWFEVTT